MEITEQSKTKLVLATNFYGRAIVYCLAIIIFGVGFVVDALKSHNGTVYGGVVIALFGFLLLLRALTKRTLTLDKASQTLMLKVWSVLPRTRRYALADIKEILNNTTGGGRGYLSHKLTFRLNSGKKIKIPYKVNSASVFTDVQHDDILKISQFINVPVVSTYGIFNKVSK